jgi:hypothetical protein
MAQRMKFALLLALCLAAIGATVPIRSPHDQPTRNRKMRKIALPPIPQAPVQRFSRMASSATNRVTVPPPRVTTAPFKIDTNYRFFDVLKSSDRITWVPYLVGCYGPQDTNGDVIAYATNGTSGWYRIIPHNTLYPYRIP